MTREQAYEVVNQVFRDVLDDEGIAVQDATTAADVEDWDSLEHINLILGMERGFHMKFSMGEVTSMKNVGEMVDIILERSPL
jgi:acyl carrier protein